MSDEYYESPAVMAERLCPIVNGYCLGRRCLKVVEKTETWTTEEMYKISHHSRKMLRCSEFPDVIWWQPKEESK